METYLLIIIWIGCLLILSIVIGEIYYRFKRKRIKTIQNNKINNAKDSIDTESKDLKIEHPSYISTKTLQMRGSWRLAKNRIQNKNSFILMRDFEYHKNL